MKTRSSVIRARDPALLGGVRVVVVDEERHRMREHINNRIDRLDTAFR